MNRASPVGVASKPGRATKLVAALIEAQSALHAPSKNRTVSVRSGRENYDFAYATLDTIIEGLLRPVLPSYGLWFTQYMRLEAGGHAMVTEILHACGETKLCPMAMPELPASAHEAGSLISYFKRYSLCAAFGLVAEDDDDARLASDLADGLISAEQIQELEALAGGGQPELDRLCRYLKVASLAALPVAKFERAKSALQVRRAA